MRDKYIYNVCDKEIMVIPLTVNDENIVTRLELEVKNYFVSDFSGQECFKLYLLSGSETNIIVKLTEEIYFLQELNAILNSVYQSYKLDFFKWKKNVEEFLVLIDYEAGLYKIKNSEKSFVVITDYKESYGQMYKLHVALESLLVYLLSFETAVLFHSSCAGLDIQKCNLFIGMSGVGKSTIARMVEAVGGKIIDDEKNIVMGYEGKYYVYSGQTKAAREQTYYKYAKYGVLKNIFFIEQSDSNYKVQLKFESQTVRKALMANCQIGGYRQGHPTINKKLIVHSIKQLMQTVPIWKLYFNLDINIKAMLE